MIIKLLIGATKAQFFIIQKCDFHTHIDLKSLLSLILPQMSKALSIRPYVAYVARINKSRSKSVSSSMKFLQESALSKRRSLSPSVKPKQADINNAFDTLQFSLNKLALPDDIARYSKLTISALRKQALQHSADFWDSFESFKNRLTDFSNSQEPDYTSIFEQQHHISQQIQNLISKYPSNNSELVKLDEKLEDLQSLTHYAFKKETMKETSDQLQSILRSYLLLTRVQKSVFQENRMTIAQQQDQMNKFIKGINLIVKSLRTAKNACQISFTIPQLIIQTEKTLFPFIPYSEKKIRDIIDLIKINPKEALPRIRSIISGPVNHESIYQKLLQIKKQFQAEEKEEEHIDLTDLRNTSNKLNLSIFESYFERARLEASV